MNTDEEWESPGLAHDERLRMFAIVQARLHNGEVTRALKPKKLARGRVWWHKG